MRGENRTGPPDWEWLKAVGWHALLILTTWQDYSAIKTVMWWTCAEGKESIKNRNRNLKNSFGQIDVSMRLKCLMSRCPTSIASLYIEGTHYFCEKEGFLQMKDQDPNRAPQVRLRTLQISFSSQMLLYRLCGSSCDAVDLTLLYYLSLISLLCCMVETCKNGQVKDFILTSNWILRSISMEGLHQ